MKGCYGQFGCRNICGGCDDSELCAIRSGDVCMTLYCGTLDRILIGSFDGTEVVDKIFELFPKLKDTAKRELILLRFKGKLYKEIAFELGITVSAVSDLITEIEIDHPDIGHALRRFTSWESSRMKRKRRRV